MNMRICHITSAHDSDDIRIFYKECVYLAKEKSNDIYLIAPGTSRIENDVTVIGVGEKPFSRVKRMIFFTRKIYNEAVKVDADIYHFHDPEFLHYGLKLKKSGKHVVFDSHENTSEQIKLKGYLPSALRKIISKLYFIYETRVVRRIDAVIFPAIDIDESKFEGRAKKIVLVDNLPILSEMIVDKTKKKSRTFCCVGTLSAERGITQMLKANKYIRGDLILAGHFSPLHYGEYLQQEGLLDGVDYRGRVDREGVVKIYNESEVGLSTLQYVGQYENATNFATKEYEYMAMGIPVVRTDFEKTRSLFEKYNFGVAVDSRNPEDIAAAVNYLFDNSEIREKLGQNGLDAARNVFNWENEVTKIKILYDELM